MIPKISVVMSVYNGEKYLKSAIDSVLQQSFVDFEFIIINDGSNDSSLNIIKSYNDKRIILIDNIVNRGLIYSLNMGFSKARGKYIVRFDADDICVKDRLRIQYDFMEKNADVAIMSAYARWFLDGIPFITKTVKSYESNDYIKGKLIFENHINHSCVILRREIIEKEKYRYEEKYLHIEDYGLWIEIAKKYKIATLNKVLLKCRISRNSVTSKANRDMLARKKIYSIIYNEVYNLIGYNPKQEDFDIHFEICMIQNINNSKYSFDEKVDYCKKIIEANNEKFVNRQILIRECNYQLYKNSLYMNCYKKYKKIDIGCEFKMTTYNYLKDKVMFLIKKLIKKEIR